jgi:ApaG protein
MAGPPRAATSDAYVAVTRGVRVVVTPRFLADRSDPGEGRFFWAYTVRVENLGEETVQLESRHWIITDGLNRTEEIRGPGVVGEQPTLRPGERFEYTSGCPLPTPSGAMRGAYQMRAASGETFEAVIPEFSLHRPEAARRLN